MILKKRKKIQMKVNNKMKFQNKNKFKIIFQNPKRRNMKSIWINFMKLKRKIRRMSLI